MSTPNPDPPLRTTHSRQRSRSPSPVPSAPIPSTPGHLATRLSEAYHEALNHVLRVNSFANFASCFPTPAARKSEVLRSVWRQISDRIEERAKAEFEDILRERDVVRGLNELEKLVGEAKGRKQKGGEGELPVAPHTLDPQSLYLAHLSPYLHQVQQELQAKLGETQAQNEQLAKGIESQREEVERLVGGLEAVMSDLEGANTVMGKAVEEGQIKREILDVDGEL